MLACFAILSIAGVAYAYQTTTTTVSVVNCNIVTSGGAVDNLCALTLGTTVAAPSGCTGQNRVVWDGTTAQGKNTLSLAISAHLAGARVTAYVYRCSSVVPGLPELGSLDLL